MPEIRVRHLDPSSLEVTPLGRTALRDEPITIGRASENDIVLSTNRVSRAHCVVEPTAHGFRVRDTGSTFGTMVNGERVDIQILASGDVIGIAGFELQFVEPERDTALLPPDPEEQQRTIDALIAQRDAAAAKRDAAVAERDEVIRERDAALDAGDAATQSLVAERDAARADARSAQDALDVVRAERQAADDQRSAAQHERDDARQRVQSLEDELEALRAADDATDDLDAERARWASTRTALESTIDALEQDLARLAAERDAARAEARSVTEPPRESAAEDATDDLSADAPDAAAPDDAALTALQDELDAVRAALDAERTVAATAVAERDALRETLDAAPAGDDAPFDPAPLVAHLDAVREMARHLLNVDAVLRQREEAFAELDASVRAAESDDGENIDLELLNARDLEAAAFEAAHDDRDAALGALRERLDALDHALADDAPREPAVTVGSTPSRRGGWLSAGLVLGMILGAALGVVLARTIFAAS